MNDEQIQDIRKNIGEKDFERLLRMYDEKTDPGEKRKLGKMVFGNHILRIKRSLRDSINSYNELFLTMLKYIEILKIKHIENNSNEVKIKEIENCISEITNAIEPIEQYLADMGEELISLFSLYSTVATDHDFSQLIGANFKNVEKCKKHWLLYKGDDDLLYLDLVLIYRVESRNKKVLSFFKDINAPFYEAILQMYSANKE